MQPSPRPTRRPSSPRICGHRIVSTASFATWISVSGVGRPVWVGLLPDKDVEAEEIDEALDLARIPIELVADRGHDGLHLWRVVPQPTPQRPPHRPPHLGRQLVHHGITASAFPARPARPSPQAGDRETSRFSAWRDRTHATGSQTPWGPLTAREHAASGVAFRRLRPRRHPNRTHFEAQSPGLRAPLSTLRLRPRGRLRMTQGHRDSLDLRCRILSFPSLMPVVRRFP